MTIQANYYPLGETGNGSTTTFGIIWPFRAQQDVVVQLLDATGNLVSPPPVLNGGGTYDYVITGTPDPDTGFYASANVVFNTAPPSGYSVLRYRATQDWQDKVFVSNGRFPAKSNEAALDRRTLVDQEQDYQLGGGSSASGGRIVRMYPFDLSAFNPVMPDTVNVPPGSVLTTNPNGNGWTWTKAYATGVASITGTPNQIEVTVDANGNANVSLPEVVVMPGSDPGLIHFEWVNSNAQGTSRVGAENDKGNVVALQIGGSASAVNGAIKPDMGVVYTGASQGLAVGTNTNAPVIFIVGAVGVGAFTNNAFFGVNTITPANAIDAVQDNGTATISIRSNLTSNLAGFVATVGPSIAGGAANQLSLGVTGPAYVPLQNLGPNTAVLSSEACANGLWLATQANAPISFCLNGYNPILNLVPEASGTFSMQSTHASVGTANVIDLSGNGNAGVVAKLSNSNAGPNAYTALYMQNDTHDNAWVQLISSGTAASGLEQPRGMTIFCDGPGGLMLATNSASPIRFSTNAVACANFNVNGALEINPGIGQLGLGANYIFGAGKNQNANTYLYLANGIASATAGQVGVQLATNVTASVLAMLTPGYTANGLYVANATYLGAGQTLVLTTQANYPLQFGVANTLVGQFSNSSPSYFYALGGYAGGLPVGNHYLYQTVGANAVVAAIHNAANPSGVQTLFSTAPNDTGHYFFQGMDGYGTTYQNRFYVQGNGGVANFSANNVNLSDATLKSEIERIADDDDLAAKLWDGFRRVDWGRFKYLDQTHDDYNYGYTAQGVREAFGDVAPELVTVWDEGRNEEWLDARIELLGGTKPDRKLAVYDHDLMSIGQAVLAMAQARIEQLEARIHKLERTKH